MSHKHSFSLVGGGGGHSVTSDIGGHSERDHKRWVLGQLADCETGRLKSIKKG